MAHFHADLLGYVVSRVENGHVTSYRLPGRQVSIRVPGVTSARGVVLKVWAVNSAGFASHAATIHVRANPAFIRFTLSSKRVAPVSVDPLTPTFRGRVGARGTLQWIVDADQAARIKGWTLHVLLHDGTAIEVPLSANARHWVLPSTVLSSIRASAVFAAPYVLVEIVPRGLRFEAEITLYPVR